MPADQYPWMATFYVVFAACIWANFRSRIELSGHQLRVTNPWGTSHVDTTDVTEVTPGSWGVEIHRTNHRPLIAFAVQCTFVYLTERPRWVDIAEAVTGREPEWRMPRDPDD